MMIRSDLICALAEKRGTGPREAETIVDAILGSLFQAMLRGEPIDLRGFGSFRIRNHRAYTGRNPKTGETIEVKTKRLPHFKPSKAILERINRSAAKATTASRLALTRLG